MVIDGLILVLLTILIVIGMIVCNHWIRKVTNCYFFWAIIAGFFLIWLFIFRFGPDISRFIHTPITDPSDIQQSIVISKAFMLDVCPFAAIGMCATLIFDPTRKIARSLAPIALIGGAITVCSVAFDESIHAALTAQFIFIGDPTNSGMKCYFIMHFIQVVLAVGVMLNTPRNGWKGTLGTLIIISAYYIYVAIVMAATGATWNVSGLSINDWLPEGEYHYVAEIFNIPPKVCQIIGIPILGLVGCGLIALKDYVFDRGWFWYGNAYSGKWYLWYNYNNFVKQKVL